MTNKSTLVIGGCRSGKSGHALKLASGFTGRKIFIATCVPHDSEMEDRVAKHKKERPSCWTTVEEPLRVPEALIENSKNYDVILVDCLTLWITNMLMKDMDDDKVLSRSRALAGAVEASSCPVIMVSNQVGGGIVPENNLARRFRDLAGFVNQEIASAAEKVVLMVAGIPVPVK